MCYGFEWYSPPSTDTVDVVCGQKRIVIEHIVHVYDNAMFKHDDYASAPFPTNSSHPHWGSVPRNLKSAFDEIKLRVREIKGCTLILVG